MKEKREGCIDDITGELDKVTLSKKVTFVVNPIIYTSGIEADESSDEEYDSSDVEMLDCLDVEDYNTFPFRTVTVKESRAKKNKGKIKVSTPIGFLYDKKVVPEEYLCDVDPNQEESTVVKPFLDHLYQEGLEGSSKDSVEDVVSASIALNRPLSLSTRKNDLLKRELGADTEGHPITHRKFGVWWRYKWYDSKNKVAKYKDVKSFYKKLKRYDKDHETSKSEGFRSKCESGIAVPYQELRDMAKNDENTKQLIEQWQENPNNDVYLSIVDGDTKSFNGIYGAYKRIHKKSDTAPTIMSTGYEFTEEQEGDRPFVEGSKLCREIRVATAQYVKLGVYITEPNFCVLVPHGDDTIKESFIDPNIRSKNAESVALMRNMIASRGIDNIDVVMSDDNPLLTTIPDRVRLTKRHKVPIKFSKEFQSGLGPTEKDIRLYKQMSQSHVHESVWVDNLSINKAIVLKPGFHFKFKGLLTKYLKSNIDDKELESLLEIVSKEDLSRIKKAYEAKEEVIQSYKSNNLRNIDQDELIEYISGMKMDIGGFDPGFLQIVANAEIIALIKSGLLDLEEMSIVSNNILEEILYNSKVLEVIREEEFTLQESVQIYNAAQKYGADFDEVFEDFVTARGNGEYLVSEIIEKYNENQMHLMFMVADDPTDLVLEKSDDPEIVRFGVEHYDIDTDWIRSELEGDRDDSSAACMDFEVFIGYHKDDDMGRSEDERYEQERYEAEYYDHYG